MGIEINNLFAVLTPHLKSRDIHMHFAVLAQQSTRPFLLLADEKIDEEAFADLFGAHEGDDAEIGVGLIHC